MSYKLEVKGVVHGTSKMLWFTPNVYGKGAPPRFVIEVEEDGTYPHCEDIEKILTTYHPKLHDVTRQQVIGTAIEITSKLQYVK